MVAAFGPNRVVCVCVCVCVCAHVCVCVCACACVHTRVCVCECVCVHVRLSYVCLYGCLTERDTGRSGLQTSQAKYVALAE